MLAACAGGCRRAAPHVTDVCQMVHGPGDVPASQKLAKMPFREHGDHLASNNGPGAFGAQLGTAAVALLRVHLTPAAACVLLILGLAMQEFPTRISTACTLVLLASSDNESRGPTYKPFPTCPAFWSVFATCSKGSTPFLVHGQTSANDCRT